MGIFSKLFSKKLNAASAEELADMMIAGDIAPDLASEIAGKLKQSANPKETLRAALLSYAKKLENNNCGLRVAGCSLLLVGVNGSGKTTTVGKLAYKFKKSGQDVIIGACDTFRAAANEQLDIWAKRAGAEIMRGTEPAAVAYKTIENQGDKIALLDTAGRLHNRQDLMDELAKIVRVIKKLDANAPTETWLVLDGTTGQNALAQIEYFNKAAPLSGLVITKMDGTNKAGFLISYAAKEKNPLPVVYMGYGEKIEDLRPFAAEEYVDKMLA